MEKKMLKENEIRPLKIFDEYLRLAEQDIKDFFHDCIYEEINCPACGENGKFEFNKKGFEYRLCNFCKTLFVSPRPNREAFARFYSDSPASRFWAESFYKKTETIRRQTIIAPKAKLVLEKIKKYKKNVNWLVDVGAGYGVFLEEFIKVADPCFKTIAIEPSDSLSEVCRGKGLTVIKGFMEELEKEELFNLVKGAGIFVCFELLEHVSSPEEFLSSCSGKMSKGDVLIFTTLSSTGFDIQLLWENSKSVSPPHHINFFNPLSIEILLKRVGFDVLEVTTPGKLDVDIVVNNLEKVNDGFLKTFLENCSDSSKKQFQMFLENNNLSSHMMVVASKK